MLKIAVAPDFGLIDFGRGAVFSNDLADVPKKIAARVAIWSALIRSRPSSPQLERMTISLLDQIYADENIIAAAAGSLHLDV
jgi:hypothetical protein